MRVLSFLVVVMAVGLLFGARVYAADLPPWKDTTPKVVSHTVQKNEELHLLAGYYLLNPREWSQIYNWNRGVIKNSNLIYPGQILTVYVDSDWTPPFDLNVYVKSGGQYFMPQTEKNEPNEEEIEVIEN